MTKPAPKSGIEKWQDGINSAAGNTAWDEYDCEIQRAVAEFNHHLVGTPAFRPLDWKLIKAMIWVETGASHAEWKLRPMQIGVLGDPGLSSLLSQDEGGELVLPPAWRPQLTVGSVRTNPVHNIRAGVGYLLMRMAKFEHQSILEPHSPIDAVTVKPGDSFSKLATRYKSTPDLIRTLNPGVVILRPGQVLKSRRGSVRRVITGWRPISTLAIAARYNGRGDPAYGKKLDYALKLIQKNAETLCNQ